ncbi:hypothetical protein LMG24235_08151 [Paraburkholderia sabiae]|nr:hypothetical protein LMG24235_08151 [Paraburkholderia sabiae]
MKQRTEKTQALRRETDECDYAQSHRIGGPGTMSSDPERIWAWATSGGQYDWMDSHAPFAHLD